MFKSTKNIAPLRHLTDIKTHLQLGDVELVVVLDEEPAREVGVGRVVLAQAVHELEAGVPRLEVVLVRAVQPASVSKKNYILFSVSKLI